MRTAIIVIIVIQLIADVVASLALLGQNFLLAILGLALAFTVSGAADCFASLHGGCI